MARLRGNRSVIEVMVLSFTLVVGISLISLSATVVYIAVAHPETDVDRLAATLTSLLSSILGALLGLIAGRATISTELHTRPEGDDDKLGENE